MNPSRSSSRTEAMLSASTRAVSTRTPGWASAQSASDRDRLAGEPGAAGARHERVAALDLAVGVGRAEETGVADRESVGPADDYVGVEGAEPHRPVRSSITRRRLASSGCGGKSCSHASPGSGRPASSAPARSRPIGSIRTRAPRRTAAEGPGDRCPWGGLLPTC